MQYARTSEPGAKRELPKRGQKKMDDARVTVQSKGGDHDSVTKSTFRAWKKRVGADKALMLQVPDSEGRFVQTWRDMQALPPGTYEAELLQKVKFPSKLARGALKGCDAWKCV